MSIIKEAAISNINHESVSVHYVSNITFNFCLGSKEGWKLLYFSYEHINVPNPFFTILHTSLASICIYL
jgi:hypothetical protein